MSKQVSPLFKTRGVPGTHDTKLLYKCLKNLKNKNFQKHKYHYLINQMTIDYQKKNVKKF